MRELTFISEEHERRFHELKSNTFAREDIEYHSAYYLLALIQRPMDKYLSKYGTEFEALIQDSVYWEEKERAIVNLANSLYSGVMEHRTDIHDIFNHLNQPLKRAAIYAIMYRYNVEM